MRNGKTRTTIKKCATSENGMLQRCRLTHISVGYFMEVVWG
ncbi:hypothetical protein [Thermococcus profundus]|nr:hypothetical protein [Thermococcus profundus]